MRLEEMHPFVRFACRMQVSLSRSGRLCAARDCRLFRLETGSAVLSAKGMEDVEMTGGGTVYVPSGCPYRITMQGECVFTIVNFDFDRKNASVPHPMPLAEGGVALDAFEVPFFEDAPFFAQPFSVRDNAETARLFHALAEEDAQPQRFSQAVLSSVLAQLLCAIARGRDGGRNVENDAVMRMVECIRENYAQPLTNSDIAALVNYHPNYANRLFERQTGQTLRQYLIGVRVSHAVTLLLSTTLSVSEIAQRVGFSSLSLFTKQFTHVTGVAPSKYRKSVGV